jgi:hypothetical protein
MEIINVIKTVRGVPVTIVSFEPTSNNIIESESLFKKFALEMDDSLTDETLDELVVHGVFESIKEYNSVAIRWSPLIE